MSTPTQQCGSASRGFSLVEVMVALVVIAVGMLGIAKMHALALESTASAGTRSLVAIETAGMAAAIHADRDYWIGLSGTNLVKTAYFIGGKGASLPTTNIAISSNCVTPPTSMTTPCNNSDIAGYDLLSYAEALQQILPYGNATITCQNATLPLSCTITVTWLEQSPGLSQTSSAALVAGNSATASAPPTNGLLQQPQYTLYLEP